MKKVCLIFILILSLLPVSADDDDEKLKLAVMEFEDLSGKLSKKMLSVATEQIRSKFVASNKFIVIAKERQENAMIKQMKKESYKLCNDKNCQIPLGQALSADTILRTTITFFGGTYTITSELIDLAKEATTKGAQASFDGGEESLSMALDNVVAQIIGTTKQQENSAQISKDKYACEYAKSANSVEAWQDYIDSFPYGKCSFEARGEIRKLKKEIEQQEKKAAYLKGRKIGNLIWSDSSSDKMNWNNAKKYCENLTEGGFNDWRLPNIDELRTLIQNHSGTQTGGTCEISEKAEKLTLSDRTSNCDGRSGSNFSKLGDTGWFWSSSIRSDSLTFAWFVVFINGIVNSTNTSYSFNVRCVR